MADDEKDDVQDRHQIWNVTFMSVNHKVFMIFWIHTEGQRREMTADN